MRETRKFYFNMFFWRYKKFSTTEAEVLGE